MLLNTVLAADIAYLVKTGPDPYLKAEIISMNISYDTILESNIGSTNFSKYKMILIGDENFDNVDLIPATEHNSLVINSYNFFSTGSIIVDYQLGWSKRRGSGTSPTKMQIDNATSPITQGVQQYFNAYTLNDINTKTYYLSGQKPTGIKLLASISGVGHTSADSVIALANNGTKMLNGKTVKKRSLFFGITKPQYWTPESRKLFRNSVYFVMNGEDKDNDGFRSDADCNDNDPSINPNATEIPYDGIDQNCNRYDLTDVDRDGYNSTIVSGTDCNDNNATINPSNPSPYYNCINDAPVMQSIPNMIKYEGDLIVITVNATDPENDALTYTINDSRFSQSVNVFNWQTGYDDAGDYFFKINVSDGNLTVSKTFSIDVRERNRASLTYIIPNLSWNEDTVLELNLSNYFYDEDKEDTLVYGVSNTSNDTHIVLNISGSIARFSVYPDWNGNDWIRFFAFDGLNKTVSNNITLTVLPVNDAPFLKSQIPNQTWNEDTNITLNLSNYFGDVDGDLSYSIVGNSNINAEISGNMIKFVPNQNWNGEREILINATDSEFSVASNNFLLKVLSVNDNPVLDFINDLFVLAGNKVKVIPSASDVDGDTLSFNFQSPLDENGEWQTSSFNKGVYNSGVSVTDGNNGSASQTFKINVFQKILINEILSSPLSGSEWVEIYNPYDQSVNLSSCVLKNSANDTVQLNGTITKEKFMVFELSNKLNNAGDMLRLYCSNDVIDSVTYGNLDDENTADNAPAPGFGESIGRDPDGADTDNDLNDFKIFTTPTKGFPSNTDMIPPRVQLLTPSNSYVSNVRDVTFEFVAIDDNTPNLNCSLFVDKSNSGIFEQISAKSVENGITSTLTANNLADRIYLWNVKCSDKDNSVFSPNNRSFSVSAPDNPSINSIGNKVVEENQVLTFNISATDPDAGDTFRFNITNKPEGSNFTDNLNGVASFVWIPEFTQAGNYDVTFVVRDSTGLEGSRTIQIKVTEEKEPPRFSDINRCDAVDQRLIVTIEDPSEGDSFEIGEKIEVEARIVNNYTDDLDVETTAYLYDITKENIIAKIKDSVDVDSGDSERVSFEEMEIPQDIKDNEFAIFVLAEGDNNIKLCNEAYIRIEIERPDELMIIEDVTANPEIAEKNSLVDLTIDVRNIGADSQEGVYLVVENTELKISKKSEAFDLEEFDDDDSNTVTIQIEIPKTAVEKSYPIKVSLFFEDKALADSKTLDLSVMERERSVTPASSGGGIVSIGMSNLDSVQPEETIKLGNKKTQNITPEREKTFAEKLKTFGMYLLAGIIVLITLIIFVSAVRRRAD